MTDEKNKINTTRYIEKQEYFREAGFQQRKEKKERKNLYVCNFCFTKFIVFALLK